MLVYLSLFFSHDTTNVQRAVTYYVPEILKIKLFTSVSFTSEIVFI